MYYIVQENVFRERNYDNLIMSLDRSGFEYEIVSVHPFVNNYNFKTTRKDVFPFGSLKMARLSRELDWYPGSMMSDTHDYMVYKDYYGEHLLNSDSRIVKFGDEFEHDRGYFFARPTQDTKVFTGQVFSMAAWKDFVKYHLNNGHETLLTKDTLVQISSMKQIYKECRFWIVKGEVITASQYKLGTRAQTDPLVDDDAYEFCRKMVDIYQLAEAFVMDLGLTDDGWKIVECGCINCAGFYDADMGKLLNALELAFSTTQP